MRAGAQLRQLLRQLVVHGDQLAVQHHVHVALVGLDLGGGRRHDLGARQLQLERQVGALDDLRSEEHTSELQSRENLVCRLLLEKKKKIIKSDIVSNKKNRRNLIISTSTHN